MSLGAFIDLQNELLRRRDNEVTHARELREIAIRNKERADEAAGKAMAFEEARQKRGLE